MPKDAKESPSRSFGVKNTIVTVSYYIETTGYYIKFCGGKENWLRQFMFLLFSKYFSGRFINEAYFKEGITNFKEGIQISLTEKIAIAALGAFIGYAGAKTTEPKDMYIVKIEDVTGDGLEDLMIYDSQDPGPTQALILRADGAYVPTEIAFTDIGPTVVAPYGEELPYTEEPGTFEP